MSRYELMHVEFPPAERSYAYQKTYVYFIQARKSGLIKIGTAWNVKTRFSSIQTGNHEPLALVCWIEGGIKLERELHHRFQSTRIQGEWFQPSIELKRLIHSVVSPGYAEEV